MVMPVSISFPFSVLVRTRPFPRSTASATRWTPQGCRPWPTPRARAQPRRSGSRSAAGGSIRTPAAADGSPAHRRRSTPPTPAAADRLSGSTPRSELAGPSQDPLQPSRVDTLVKAVQAPDPCQLTSGWKGHWPAGVAISIAWRRAHRAGARVAQQPHSREGSHGQNGADRHIPPDQTVEDTGSTRRRTLNHRTRAIHQCRTPIGRSRRCRLQPHHR